LLVVESGKGITVHTLAATGCISSSKTLISQTNLNHGIFLTPDSKTLYASSSTTVWRWTYDPVAAAISGSSTVVVNGMLAAGHVSRTLSIPKNNPNLLVVSHGSNGNLDMPTVSPSAARAIVKVFNMSNVPSGGYNYVSGGYTAGYGLRNEVGIVFDGNNM
jgi:glucose/arabinose dehydrogenase